MTLSTGLLTILLLGTAAAATARDSAAGRSHDNDRDDRDGRHGQPHAPAQNAPEISAGSMLAALTLLGGGLVVLRPRRGSSVADRQ